MVHEIANDLDAIARIDAVQKILEVVCRTTGLGFAAVARVTQTHWVACAVRDEIAFGLRPGGELGIETTICNEIRDHGEVVVIDHVDQDPRFCKHHTPEMYGFQSYISVPITLPTGQFFGTLCAIDPRPAKVNTPETIGMFKLFSDLIAQHLDAQRRVDASEQALSVAKEASLLREQFIAVLGHDLRNPLNAIGSAADLLEMLAPGEQDPEVVGIIKNSVARMASLIDDVLDFARGRLGAGLSVRKSADPKLGDALAQVVNELRTAWPSRAIHHEVSIDRAVACDTTRVAQMLSNLIGNALTHGDPAGPVSVSARTRTEGFEPSDVAGFELSVANQGRPIPPEMLGNLFQPFVRGKPRQGPQGLGLGLYIASEIARAHGGRLDVASDDAETRFTFRMPLN